MQDRSAFALKKCYMPLLQLLLALLISFISLPELALHTISRTITVSGIAAGWPLPLISPLYLISLPIYSPFPRLAGTPVQYAIGAIFYGLVIFYSIVKLRDKSPNYSVAALTFVTFSGMAISSYILAYYIKGDTYQVWKLAAFIVIPTSFVINALIAKCIMIVGENKSKVTRTLIFSISILIVLVSLASTPIKSVLDPYSIKIESLKTIRDQALAEGVENIILGIAPFGDTMAAFNYLSKDFKLFPLSKSYISAAKEQEFGTAKKNHTRLLIPAKCAHIASDAPNLDGFTLVSDGSPLSDKFYFNVTDLECSFYSGVTLLRGFSNAEPWGTWTIGNKATIDVVIPKNLFGKDFLASFEINPFGDQDVIVRGNGGVLGHYILKKPTTLSLKIPSDIVRASKISFEFIISNPRLASELNPNNHDPRLLGLGFVSLILGDGSK